MCPIGFLMLGSTLQDLPSDSPAVCRSACRRRRASPRTGSHQRTILACTRRILIGHAVELATAQPPPDDGQVQTDASAGPAPPAPASSARLRLRQTTSRSWTQRATTPTPAIPAIRLPAHRRAPGPHFGRTQRTRQRTDTGRRHRTPDSWTLRRPHRTLDSGPVDRQPWTLVARTGHRTPDTGHRTPDTGHRTPDAGRGRGQADEGAAGIRTSWATTPSDRTLGRPTVFLWTAPAALDSPCRLGGEAAFQREIASRRQLLGRSAGVERRLGALLSSND
jgi:hypothetical protein